MLKVHYLYFIVGPDGEIVFSPPGPTAQDAWANYASYNPGGSPILGTAMDRKAIHRLGYRARSVRLEVEF